MFGTTVASQYTGKALDVLGDALRHPKFRPADLELERRVIADEAAAQRLGPERVVTDRLFHIAYPHHPYGSDVLGTPEKVTKMSRADVQQFFADQYTPSNATMVIVGDVDAATISARVRSAFGVEMTPGNPVAAKLPPPDPPPAASRETIEGIGEEAYYGVAFPAPAVTDRDVHAMDILVTLLEQGTFGRLPAALSGIAASVKATFETRRQPGLLMVVVGAPPAALPKVETTVLGVLRDLAQNGPIAAEVQATKSVLAGEHARLLRCHRPLAVRRGLLADRRPGHGLPGPRRGREVPRPVPRGHRHHEPLSRAETAARPSQRAPGTERGAAMKRAFRRPGVQAFRRSGDTVFAVLLALALCPHVSAPAFGAVPPEDLKTRTPEHLKI
jgi:hypothetical protein